ncbi:MAG: hypothetical protein ABEK03_03855 [Candidatus Bipolaricaulia bacterium]
MEDVLSVYQQPYDPDRPVICPGEMSRQLLKHVREPTEVKPGTPHRHGHHCERNGTVNLSAFFESLANRRVVLTRDPRTEIDRAKCIREVLDTCYSYVEKGGW